MNRDILQRLPCTLGATFPTNAAAHRNNVGAVSRRLDPQALSTKAGSPSAVHDTTPPAS
jgi:hypothetical protein